MPVPASASSPAQAQASAGLAALESMLATYPYPLPPTNTDRLAAIRAAKVAILNGQHPQQSQHPLPGWPAPIGGSNWFRRRQWQAEWRWRWRSEEVIIYYVFLCS